MNRLGPLLPDLLTFILSSKYFLSTYYVLSIFLGSGDTAESKQIQTPASQSLHFSGKTEKIIEK